MTKTELIERQRRFEWDLARAEHTRAAGRLVAGKTHDLLNLVQIVKLASGELAKRCDATGHEFIEDLTRAARDAEGQLKSLMEVARPEHVVTRGPAVGAAVSAAVEALRPTIAIDLHLAIAPDVASELTGAELTYVMFGVGLDAAAAPRLELLVRDRTIDDSRWIEIVRGADVPAPEDGLSFDLRGVELVLARVGGELSVSDRRGGGSEVIVAFPALR